MSRTAIIPKFRILWFRNQARYWPENSENDINLDLLMPYEFKIVRGYLVLDSGIWWREVKLCYGQWRSFEAEGVSAWWRKQHKHLHSFFCFLLAETTWTSTRLTKQRLPALTPSLISLVETTLNYSSVQDQETPLSLNWINLNKSINQISHRAVLCSHI